MFTSSRFLNVLLPWRNDRLIEQAAGEVARQCQGDLWNKVCRRLDNMSLAEVRGYARAQAGEYAEAEVDLVLERRQLHPSLRARVLDSAIDQLIFMTVRTLLSREPWSPAAPRSLAA
jgi:hypothetical protein